MAEVVVDLPVGKKQRKEFWKAHIEACGNYSGSVAAYCREHGIAESKFFYHRQRLLKPRRGFAEVKAVEAPRKELKLSAEPTIESKIKNAPRLPDPQWVAALIKELCR